MCPGESSSCCKLVQHYLRCAAASERLHLQFSRHGRVAACRDWLGVGVRCCVWVWVGASLLLAGRSQRNTNCRRSRNKSSGTPFALSRVDILSITRTDVVVGANGAAIAPTGGFTNTSAATRRSFLQWPLPVAKSRPRIPTPQSRLAHTPSLCQTMELFMLAARTLAHTKHFCSLAREQRSN